MHDSGYGFCECGCGQKTELYRHTDKRTGTVRGEPRPWCRGHHQSPVGPKYEVLDLGYTTPCWIWKNKPNAGGYGRTINDQYAHVAAYVEAFGPVPEGLTVDHLCHNADKCCPGGNTCLHRRCVNVLHLEAVPTGTNTRRGRLPKLTPEQVRRIRSCPKTYGSTLALAREFGVHPNTITTIRNQPDRA